MASAFAFSPVAIDRGTNNHNNGIGPQAGGFSTINAASAPGVKTTAKLLFSKVTFAAAMVFSSEVDTGCAKKMHKTDPVPIQPEPGLDALQRPRSRSSTSEEANPSAGAPIEAWNERSASRVSPPSWPSGVPR